MRGMENYKTKTHSFAPDNNFEIKKNQAIMINKIFSIIKSDNSDKF